MHPTDSAHLIGVFDDDTWAIHKPAGLLIHPADQDGVPDLIGWLRAQPDLPPGLAPAHRLDLDASGVVLCGATGETRRRIASWFAENALTKTYLTVVHGRTRKKGVIRRPLKDGRRGRPLPALTRYKRLEWIGRYTLLVVHPASGRKHQIRRHLHGIGHPILGDRRYRGRRASTDAPGRLWLHARALQLPTGAVIEDPLPPELCASLDTLRERQELSTRGSDTADPGSFGPDGSGVAVEPDP